MRPAEATQPLDPASGSIPTTALPVDLARNLPRYATLPAVLIGRLAVDIMFAGRGFGRLLLWDAIDRALRSEQANFTLLVDAKDDAAAAFYRHHGFISFATAADPFPATCDRSENPAGKPIISRKLRRAGACARARFAEGWPRFLRFISE